MSMSARVCFFFNKLLYAFLFNSSHIPAMLSVFFFYCCTDIASSLCANKTKLPNCLQLHRVCIARTSSNSARARFKMQHTMKTHRQWARGGAVGNLVGFLMKRECAAALHSPPYLPLDLHYPLPAMPFGAPVLS